MRTLVERSRSPMVIHVPTKNEIKLGTVRRASSNLGLTNTTIGHDGIQSGVPEQPNNIYEGLLGAGNRAKRLSQKLEKEGIGKPSVLAIENFVHPVSVKVDPEIWNGTSVFDAAAVVLMGPDGEYDRVFSSAGLRFPQKYYLVAQAKGLATSTVGQALEEDFAKHGLDSSDPHAYLTGGAYTRGDFLILPTALALMDNPNQGEKLRELIRENISKANLSLPDGIEKVVSTSTQPLKNAAIASFLEMVGGQNLTIEAYDGNSEDSPAQIMDLTTCFKEAYDRIQNLHRKGIQKSSENITISIQSCVCPIVLDGTSLRFIDMAVVLLERIDKDGIPHYYSSVSAGTEFPKDKVMLAANKGFDKMTVGMTIAGTKGDYADPQLKLYGISRQLLLEEAIFAAFAQMQSGLEVK